MARGLFITLEGVDGCGKSTQAARLARWFQEKGREVVSLREPGGTTVSERIRALLLDPASGPMDPRCELLLFEASRAQLVAERIAPALGRGAVVVCDRFFDSTSAYQRAGRGLDAALVDEANALACGGTVPDVTLWIDVDPAQALARAGHDGADRLEAEGLGLQERVRAGYRAVAQAEPGRVVRVDGAGDPDEVFSAVLAALAERGIHG